MLHPKAEIHETLSGKRKEDSVMHPKTCRGGINPKLNQPLHHDTFTASEKPTPAVFS